MLKLNKTLIEDKNIAAITHEVTLPDVQYSQLQDKT
jgi:hypothetical protein